jgi:serine/threonine protein kinase
MSETTKERFGRYLILDHLVDGGMAKICRARFLGEQADKVVAIKMIQPQYSADESFKTMFMDEIKVTFGLLHPNIVQTYDYGIHKDQLFVAMEYCDGRNLKEYLDRLRQKKFVFPVEISVYIISQVCQGLHYSHTFTDKLTGKDAHIVHRDISPHNIMLTYDGSVKIIDFGIAKANTNSEATQAGTIKGKLSYLAPEYLDGLTLDARYDMFAVGITLWEMLCSRKLFKAANDLAVLKKIQECKIPPPSKINPNVPKELDDIVLQALKKDRNKRFENMDQLNRALIKFLYANYPDFNSSDLSYFAKELFKDEIKKDREKLFEFGKINIKPFLNDWKNEQEGGTRKSAPDPSDAPQAEATGTNTRKQEQVLDFGFEDETATKTGLSRRKAAAKSTPAQRVKAGDDKLKVNSLAPKKRKVAELPPSQMGATKSKVKKRKKADSGTSTTSISISKKNSGPIKLLAMCAVFALIGHFGRNDIPVLKEYIGDRVPASVVEPAKPVVPVKKKPAEDIGTVRDQLRKGIRISNFDGQIHKVFVDGIEKKPDFLKKINIPINKEIVLRVERAGFRHFVKRLKITNQDSVKITIPDLPQENFGYLYVSRGCQIRGRLSFSLYGEDRMENVPLRSPLGIAFPVNGDGRHPANADGKANFEVYFQKIGTKIKRKIKFSFKNDDDRIDLCGL